MSRVKRSTSLRPYRSMTHEGMADRAPGETRRPRTGGRCPPRRAAQRSALRASMTGSGHGRDRVPASDPAGRLSDPRRPFGVPAQWAAAVLAAPPMASLVVAARWRRPGSRRGAGTGRERGRSGARPRGASRHVARFSAPGERPRAELCGCCSRPAGRARGDRGSRGPIAYPRRRVLLPRCAGLGSGSSFVPLTAVAALSDLSSAKGRTGHPHRALPEVPRSHQKHPVSQRLHYGSGRNCIEAG